MDRRILRTRTHLKAALTELLAKKDLQEITVCELAEKVNISRGTFYLHYKNAFDMLQKIEEEMLDGLRQAIAVPPQNTTENPFWRLKPTYEFFSQNAALTAVLLGPHGDHAFMKQVQAVLSEECRRDYARAFPSGKAQDYEYLFAFLLGGSLSMLEVWLRTGQQESPEFMAERTNRVVLEGVQTMFEKS